MALEFVVAALQVVVFFDFVADGLDELVFHLGGGGQVADHLVLLLFVQGHVA